MAKNFASTGDLSEKKITFSEIGTDLYAFTAEGDPNTAVIVGDDSCLVFDAQATPAMANKVIERVKTVTDKPIKYVVLSHYHAVRVLGASAYKAQGIVASQETYRLIEERGQQDWDSEYGRFPRLFQDARIAGTAVQAVRRDVAGPVYVLPSSAEHNMLAYVAGPIREVPMAALATLRGPALAVVTPQERAALAQLAPDLPWHERTTVQAGGTALGVYEIAPGCASAGSGAENDKWPGTPRGARRAGPSREESRQPVCQRIQIDRRCRTPVRSSRSSLSARRAHCRDHDVMLRVIRSIRQSAVLAARHDTARARLLRIDGTAGAIAGRSTQSHGRHRTWPCQCLLIASQIRPSTPVTMIVTAAPSPLRLTVSLASRQARRWAKSFCTAITASGSSALTPSARKNSFTVARAVASAISRTSWLSVIRLS